MIKKFTILGERCSGTNFLENAIRRNFDIDITWDYGWKHFFGFNDYKNSDDVLFIGIVRNPYTWVDSLFRTPHHLQDELRIRTNNLLYDQHKFLTSECWSYRDDNNSKSINEIMEDRNIYTKGRYKNIFEMRKVKCHYLLNDMPKKVKNYILIRYEDLRDNYNNILNIIGRRFNLKKKHATYEKILTDKGIKNGPLFKRNHPIIIQREKIKKGLDVSIEAKLGYL